MPAHRCNKVEFAKSVTLATLVAPLSEASRYAGDPPARHAPSGPCTFRSSRALCVIYFGFLRIFLFSSPRSCNQHATLGSRGQNCAWTLLRFEDHRRALLVNRLEPSPLLSDVHRHNKPCPTSRNDRKGQAIMTASMEDSLL